MATQWEHVHFAGTNQALTKSKQRKSSAKFLTKAPFKGPFQFVNLHFSLEKRVLREMSDNERLISFPDHIGR